jgi:hypothetical protein
MSTSSTTPSTYKRLFTMPISSPKPYVNSIGFGFDYIINSMLLISIVGMCIKIFFGSRISKDGTYGPANSVIYGYGLVALSVLTVIFVSYAIHDRIGNIENRGSIKNTVNFINNKGKMTNIVTFLKSFLSSSAPSIITILSLLWIITLNISHYSRINKGMVATEYYQLSTGTSFLFIIQLICVFQYLKLFIQSKSESDINKKNEIIKTQSRIAFATYFITALNLIVAGMMTIILQFFSTDG